MPPSPLHRARWKHARHWKARVVVLKHIANLATVLAAIAFGALCYHAPTIYSARQGYGGLRSDVARVGLALFLGGLLVGWFLSTVWAGRRR